jgi:hypothetical protein
LVRVTDAKGEPDVLLDDSTADRSIISENIYDLQIVYKTYVDFLGITPTTTPDPSLYYFAGSTIANSSSDADELMKEIRRGLLKQLDITVVALTDEFSGAGTVTHSIPAIGDEDAYELTPGKYGCNIYSLTIEPWNYSWLAR